MKPRVYVETGVVSYLTARPARDVVIAARQRDPAAARARLGALASSVRLDATAAAAQELTERLGSAQK